jgi:protein dithiol:quinone oxidoreductase
MQKYVKIISLSPRVCYGLVASASFGSVLVALYMQHGQGLQPCTLCIIQRYAFLFIGIAAFVAVISPVRWLRALLSAGAILVALGGAVAALRNLWVMAHPDILCGRDPVELFLNGLPTAQWYPKIFAALGLCSDPIPPLLGLPLPAWSLIGFLLLAMLLWIALRQR